MIAFTLLTRFIYLDFLSVLSPLAFHFPKLSTRQRIYLTHNWDSLPLASHYVRCPMLTTGRLK